MKKSLTCVILGIITCVMLSFGISGMVYAADVTVPESAITVGDLSIWTDDGYTLTENTDYTYASNELTIQSEKPVYISGKTQQDRVVVKKDVNANIILAGVEIDVSNVGDDLAAAFKIANSSKGNVTVTLKDGSKNILKSAMYAAGLQKNGEYISANQGKLVIRGNGELQAESCDHKWSNPYGAGIGSGSADSGDNAYPTANITIESGTVIAKGGAGIGSGGKRIFGVPHNASYITIIGGNVTASSSTGAAIGGGRLGNTSNITISGGNVTATSNGFGAAIGGGSNATSVTNITITGGNVTATAAGSGAGIGGGCFDMGGLCTVSNITISGGVVKIASVQGSGIGLGELRGRSFEQVTGNLSNITISGGTVTVDSARHKSYTPAAIGVGDVYIERQGSVTATVENVVISGGSVLTKSRLEQKLHISKYENEDYVAVTPTDGKGNNVYLAVIENPLGEDVYIDGVKYTPANHSAVDPTNTNLYAYVKAATLDNFTVTVGQTTKQLPFNSASGIFESYKFALCKTDGSVYKEYFTLDQALADVDATEQRTLIKLLADMQSEQTVSVSGVTLDLNGFSAQLSVGAEITIYGYGELKLSLNAGANVTVSPFVSKWIILSLTINDATAEVELGEHIKVLSFSGESQNKMLAEYLGNKKLIIGAEGNKMLYTAVQALKTYNGAAAADGETDKYLIIDSCNPCDIEQATAKCKYCGYQYAADITLSNGTVYDYYDSLSNAFADVKTLIGATVKVYKDDTASKAAEGGTFTLNTNGKTIGNFNASNNSNITITGNGTIKAGSSGISLGISNSTIVIEKVTIDGSIALGYGPQSLDYVNSLTIKDGTFNGEISVTHGTLNIEGGIFNGSVVVSDNALSANVTISGGVFNGGVEFTKNIKNGAQTSLTISCGDFRVITVYDFTMEDIIPENVVCVDKAMDFILTPTHFKINVQNVLIGRVKVESKDGTGAVTTRKYYLNLEQALEKATAGDTITLKFDETIDKTLLIEKNLTLDLNGYSLTMSGADSAIKVKQNITFNVVDSNSASTHTNALLPKGGVITNSNQGVEYGGAIYVEENAKLKMSGGTIYGCKATIGGAIYALGDVYISGNALITQCENGIVIEQSGSLYADGGKVQSAVTVGTIAKAVADNNITEFYGAVTASSAQTGMYYLSEEQMQGVQVGSGYLTVSYYNGESLFATLVLKQGDKAVEPSQEVTLKNYTFICWATEEGEPYEFTKGVTQELKLVAKWGATQEAVAEIIKQLEDAKKELEEATQKGDDDLTSKITDLNTALTTAEEALKATDKDNKEALEKAITDAEKALQDKIDDLTQKLTDETARLDDAISGTGGLTEQIGDLNTALTTAEAALKATDKANKEALEKAVADAEKALQDKIDDLTQKLTDETARLDDAISGTGGLTSQITDLNTALTTAEEALKATDKANKEALEKAVADAEKTLQDKIDDLTQKLTDETARLDDAISGTGGLTSQITDLNTALTTAEAALKATDKANKEALEKAVADAEKALQDKIDDLTQKLTDETARLDDAISGTGGLTEQIGDLNTALTTAEAALKATDKANKEALEKAVADAEKALQDKIQGVSNTLTSEVERLEEAIKDGDSDLSGKIDELSGTLKTAQTLLESVDAKNKEDLEKALEKAESALQTSIDAVQGNLEKAQKDLQTAIEKGDGDLSSKIEALNNTLKSAQTLLESTDAKNKEDLEKALETAESALQTSIDAVQGNLEKAQTDLQTAIEKGDSDLSAQIAAVNTALSQAQALFQSTAATDKQALEQTIADTQKSLQTAIDKVQSNLDSVKQELTNKNIELQNQNKELQTFITVVCVGVAITFVGMLSFVIWFFLTKKKGF